MEHTPLIKIAIADDHEMVRKGIANFIDMFGGFDVVLTATNGNDLISQLKKADTLPDICILDINMPEMNGFETLDILRAAYPVIRVLVLTMYDNEQTIIKMFSYGARGYLLKNSGPDELKEALLTIHAGELYHPDIKASHFQFFLHGKPDPAFPRITDKEMLFLTYCCTELSYKEIAQKMGVALRTVQGYRDSLFSKLVLKTRTGLAMYAITAGLVPLR